MFPYYLLPKAGDTQKPDAEEERENDLGEDAAATEQESEAPLAVDTGVQDYEINLYHRLGLRPPSQTGRPSSSQPTTPAPLAVDMGVQYYENNLYDRLGLTPPDETGGSTGGQGPDSDSGGQGGTDSSQLDALPDIAEVQDEFGAGGLVDGISPDRLRAFSNLEFLRVKQDIETRPLIFRHCFQHSASRQDALECIYAFPPDFDVDELWYLEQIAEQVGQDLLVAMGGDSDDENGSDFTVPYGSLVRYEEHLEDKYGFQITWGEASDRTNMAVQLNNLEKAIGYTLNYLAKEVYGDESLALEAFEQHFSQSKFGQLEIHLGIESDPNDKGYGFVPLPYYDKEGKLINADVGELRKMYLGSAVDIPTIVHEFGHVLDRSRRFTDHLTEIVPPYRMSRIATVSREYGEDYGDDPWGYYSFNLDAAVYLRMIEGFVAKQYYPQERWADLFMTAVLDPAVSGHTFYVRSMHDDKIVRPEEGVPAFPATKYLDDFDDPDPESDRYFYKCADEGIDCVTMPVMWEDTTWTEAAQSYLPRLFRERLPRQGEHQ